MWASDGAPVGLVRELDDGVGLIVEEAVEPGELALRVVADPVGNLEVLAPDDRPHGTSPARSARLVPGDGPADRARWTSSIDRGHPGTAAASVAGSSLPRHGDRRHRRGRRPEERLAAGRERRAGRHDVVDQHDPATGDRRPASAAQPRSARDVRRPVAPVELGTGRSSRRRAPSAAQPRQPRRRGGRGRDELGLVVAALAAPRRVDRDRDEQVAAGAGPPPALRDGLAERLASRRSPAYLSAWSARRSEPAERRAPLELEQRVRWASASPSGVPAGSAAGRRPGAGRRADRRPLRPAARDRRGQREVQQPVGGREEGHGHGGVWRRPLTRDSSGA